MTGRHLGEKENAQGGKHSFSEKTVTRLLLTGSVIIKAFHTFFLYKNQFGDPSLLVLNFKTHMKPFLFMDCDCH